MGRGLSELQKTILVMAQENRRTENLPPLQFWVDYKHPALNYPEVVARYAPIIHGPVYIDWIKSWAHPEFAEQIIEHIAEPHNPWKGDPPLVRHTATEDEDRAFIKTVELLESINEGFIGQSGEPNYEHTDTYIRTCCSSYATCSQSMAESLVATLKTNGFDAWIRAEDQSSADVFAWEVTGKVYGFSEHRKRFMGGYESSTHFHSREIVENGIKAQKPLGENATVAEVICHCLRGDRNRDDLEAAGRRRAGGKLYDVQAIGPERYNAAKVAVSKAFARLQERKLALVFRWPETSGIKLTDDGVKLADEIPTEAIVPSASSSVSPGIRCDNRGQHHEQKPRNGIDPPRSHRLEIDIA